MASETIDVVVQWCGLKYELRIPQEDKVHDLKRRICEVAGVPAKRQKHYHEGVVRWMEGNEMTDDNLVDSFQTTTRTSLIGLNEKIGFQIYKDHFYDGQKPKCTVKATKKRLHDFDGTKTRLYRGTYNVGSMTIGCLIKYYEPEYRLNLFRSVQLMRPLKHPNVFVMENLYCHKSNMPRLILSSKIDGSFEAYVKQRREESGEDMIQNADGSFTEFFTNILLDVCGVLDKMVKRNLCPKSITKDNFYFNMENDQPQLKILFDNVYFLDGSCNKHLLASLCSDLRNIFSHGHIKMDRGTETFLNFLGKEAVNFVGTNLEETAKYYPRNWTQLEKSRYLIEKIPSSKDVRDRINACGLHWPKNKENDDMSEELQILRKFVEEENDKRMEENRRIELQNKEIEEENKNIQEENEKLPEAEAKLKKPIKNLRPYMVWNYKILYFHDLFRMIRNMWKHYETLPASIKEYFGNSRDGTLTALERWCPNVWFLIYNAVGLAS